LWPDSAARYFANAAAFLRIRRVPSRVIGHRKGVSAVHMNVKIFITIFCYISGIMGLVSAVISATHKPADSASAIVTGSVGVAFLLAGLVLTRKPRY
jgi:hypothetical protein